MNPQLGTQLIGSADLQRFLQQMERKKEYNRSYYHSKVKPKRETEKQELDILRERCAQLEENIIQLQTGQPQDSMLLAELKRKNQDLTSENLELSQYVSKLKQDNSALAKLLDAARQRNYELMMQKADELLPNVQNLTLNS